MMKALYSELMPSWLEFKGVMQDWIDDYPIVVQMGKSGCESFLKQ